MLNKKPFLIGLIFFLLALITLPHYGTNWDTINHLPRGQAYLRFFLTGKKDYTGQKKYVPYWQNPSKLAIATDIPIRDVPTRSLYQMEDATYHYYVSIDGDGHPPLSDILSAAFNRVFFGHLRLINDIDSYRLYGVFLAACLVGLLYHWVGKTYGSTAAFFSALSLSLYPLFWSESHFNTEKDIPETVFWSFFLYSIWRGIVQKNYKWLVFSGVFFGLALGTKFNILFSVFIIVPWIVICIVLRQFKLDQIPKTLFAGAAAIIIATSIFVGSWPYLWGDPISSVTRVLTFYKGIGTGDFDSRFIGPHGIRTYPLLWIIYTTPLSILGLAAIGLIFSKKDSNYWLFFFWLLVPIVREVWPGASFYGGVRQIMEYVPAMAIFSGLGAKLVYDKLKFKRVSLLILVTLFLFTLTELINIHPNENVYFNSLVGGLSGAKAANLPYWGFSFGAPYRPGIDWLNTHAEKGAAVVFAFELAPNIPRIFIRPDLQFHNSFRSGYQQKGEYAITLTYQGTKDRSYYDSYLEDFLEPVYQSTVDGVAILKVWKNDALHQKKSQTQSEISSTTMKKTDTGLKLDLGAEYPISKLEINYLDTKSCPKLSSGYVEISADGTHWKQLPGTLPDDWRIATLGEQPKNGHFIEPFLGQTARYIFIALTPANTCLSNYLNYKVYAFTQK